MGDDHWPCGFNQAEDTSTSLCASGGIGVQEVLPSDGDGLGDVFRLDIGDG